MGVGDGVDVNELHSIADDPDSSNTFTVSDYDQLDSIATQIINRACTGKNSCSCNNDDDVSCGDEYDDDVCINICVMPRVILSCIYFVNSVTSRTFNSKFCR